MRTRIVLFVLVFGLFLGSFAVAESPVGEHAAYMELPAEYRAWFRNPDGSCAAPETPVSTTNGPVAIADLRPERDAIWYLAADGIVRSTRRYRPWITKEVKTLTVIRTSDQQTLRLTPDHRLGTGSIAPPNVHYVAAGYLQPGAPLAAWPSGTTRVTEVVTETLPEAIPVWDLQNFEPCWQDEGNFFASGILLHNCVQCSNGMVGMHLNRPEWTFLLWDTDYGRAVRGGSWPGRVADYARARGMKIFNVTGDSYADTRPWMLWAAQTNRFCAIGAGGSHFQTLYGYVPGDPRPWKVCNNNSTSRIDEYSEDEFRRLHLASGPWVVVPNEPAPAPPPRLVPWWQ